MHQWRTANHVQPGKELYELYNHPDIFKMIRTRGLRWAGHVERMDFNAAAEKIYNASVEGVRRRGRQRATWVDLVEKDTKELTIPS